MSQVTNLDVQNAAGAVVRGDLKRHPRGDLQPEFGLGGTVGHLSVHAVGRHDGQPAEAAECRQHRVDHAADLPDGRRDGTGCLTLLENLAARKLLRLGATGAEWQLDPAAGGSGATLKIGPEAAGVVAANLGLTINRATGAIEIGTGATAGAADHFKVNGGLKALLHGFTMPDGSLADTAGVRKIHAVNYNSSASYAGTSWGVMGTTLRLVITPQRTSSRFLILATVCGSCQSHGFWRVHRDGSPLVLASGAYEKALGNLFAFNSRVPITQVAAVYDSAAPGATVTYQIAFRADSGTYPVYLNNSYAYGAASYDMFGLCSLVAFEIGGV
jgi:hypothetical protein